MALLSFLVKKLSLVLWLEPKLVTCLEAEPPPQLQRSLAMDTESANIIARSYHTILSIWKEVFSQETLQVIEINIRHICTSPHFLRNDEHLKECSCQSVCSFIISVTSPVGLCVVRSSTLMLRVTRTYTYIGLSNVIVLLWNWLKRQPLDLADPSAFQ